LVSSPVIVIFITVALHKRIYSYVDDKNVVQDGNLITSRGPGTAFEFALKISEQLAGVEKAQEVAKGMLLTFN